MTTSYTNRYRSRFYQRICMTCGKPPDVMGRRCRECRDLAEIELVRRSVLARALRASKRK